MTGPISRRPPVTVVDTAAAARVLVDPAERRFLEPFLGTETTIAEVAHALSEAVERTAYKVRMLRQRGLITEVGERPRAGRPIRIYAAAATIDAPLSVLPEADVAHLFDAIDRGGREAFLAALSRLAVRHGQFDWRLRLQRVDGAVRLDMVNDAVPDPLALLGTDAPAVTFSWVPLELDAAGAKRLQHQLARLVGQLPIAIGAPTHLAGVFLTPL